ncbi:hypothetical protein EKO27_g5189 [Xylaria grammica]|uniref:Uncharacterized protein n=1 Tax=Xylaria grammica TaxID=363999 RepID=A0A439D698_9PEZI|nr:hypothetical protein EKO27_g5189 [Xylaria grammica]
MAVLLNGAVLFGFLRAVAIFVDPDPPVFDFLDREPPPYPFLTKLRQRLREESADHVNPSSWGTLPRPTFESPEETVISFTSPEPPLTVSFAPIEDSTGEVETDSTSEVESTAILTVETTTVKTVEETTILTVTPMAVKTMTVETLETPTLTVTHTATSWEDSANVDPEDKERSCDWLYPYNTDNPPEGPHEFLSKSEASPVIEAVFDARRLRGELSPGGNGGWLTGRHLHGLDEVLSFLVTTPLWKFCEALHGLVDQAADSGNKAARLVPLLDDALAKLSEGGLGTDGKLEPGIVSAGAAPALKFVVEGRGEGDRYCIGDDCNIPARIYHMWQRTEQVRGILRTKLHAVRDDLTGTRSLRSMLVETVVLLTVLIITLIAARLML